METRFRTVEQVNFENNWNIYNIESKYTKKNPWRYPKNLFKTGLVLLLIYSEIHVTNYFLSFMFYLRLFMSQTVLFVHVLPFAHT